MVELRNLEKVKFNKRYNAKDDMKQIVCKNYDFRDCADVEPIWEVWRNKYDNTLRTNGYFDKNKIYCSTKVKDFVLNNLGLSNIVLYDAITPLHFTGENYSRSDREGHTEHLYGMQSLSGNEVFLYSELLENTKVGVTICGSSKAWSWWRKAQNSEEGWQKTEGVPEYFELCEESIPALQDFVLEFMV
jgi:hypothetical protein